MTVEIGRSKLRRYWRRKYLTLAARRAGRLDALGELGEGPSRQWLRRARALALAAGLEPETVDADICAGLDDGRDAIKNSQR